MRSLIILFLSCIWTFAADTGVQMTTSLSTNAEIGVVHLEETFTRNGQTNLVRKTSLKEGVVTGRVQRFYHKGEFVAVHVLVSSPAHMARESFSTVESAYSVTLDFSPAKEVRGLGFYHRKNYLEGDAFRATNGVFYPVSSSELEIPPAKR